MLYFLYGDNIDEINKAKNRILSGRKASYIDQAKWNESLVSDYAKSIVMFGDPLVFIIDGVFPNDESRESLYRIIASLASSPNIFLITEQKATKDFLKKIEKVGGKIEFFEKKQKKTKESPFVFLISDAFCSRDKKSTWILICDAFDKDISAEEIAGTLFWAIKSMIISKKSKSLEDSFLNPFVFEKSKRFANNFTEKELQKMLFKIVSIYHEAHSGKIDFEIAIEQFVLGDI